MIDRDGAWSILTEFTKSDSLRKHALAVEASMRAYAARYGEDQERWGMAGMLHDFDYEMHPAAPPHPMKGAEILLSRGAPDSVVYAVLAHADYSGYPPLSELPALRPPRAAHHHPCGHGRVLRVRGAAGPGRVARPAGDRRRRPARARRGRSILLRSAPLRCPLRHAYRTRRPALPRRRVSPRGHGEV